MAQSSLVAPMKNPFQVVSMPKIPPIMTSSEKTSPLKRYVATSASGMLLDALISIGAANEIPIMRRQYQMMLKMMQTSTIFPMSFSAIFISSAD